MGERCGHSPDDGDPTKPGRGAPTPIAVAAEAGGATAAATATAVVMARRSVIELERRPKGVRRFGMYNYENHFFPKKT